MSEHSNLPEIIDTRRLPPTQWRAVAFSAWVLALAAVFHAAVVGWVRFAWTYDHYSHLVLIPFISAYLFYTKRNLAFRKVTTAPGTAAVVALFGVALALAARSYRGTLNENDSLAITIAGLITLIVAGFLAFWGRACARAAAFPLGFLFLAVPLPLFVLDRIIEGLRNGSAEVSYALFQVVGTPVLRQGYLFRLAHQSIEIAKECSGIRSSMALFLLVLLCGHWFLRTNIRRLILLALTVPLLIFKNAVRIVSLTLLAEYVDPSFLHGSLHRDGGVVFFAMACAIVGLMLNLLRRSEEVTASCAMASAAVAGQKV